MCEAIFNRLAQKQFQKAREADRETVANET
jgi:hypothetical protein